MIYGKALNKWFISISFLSRTRCTYPWENLLNFDKYRAEKTEA